MGQQLEEGLRFPWLAAPEPGEVVEVAPGLFWTRFALPFRLNHVNVFILEDEGGWTIVDTGLGDQQTRTAWEALLAGRLGGRPVARIIVTHAHSDHVGSAGWLADRSGAPLYMSQGEYLTATNLQLAPDAMDAQVHRAFYRGHGVPEKVTDALVGLGRRYARQSSAIPPTYRRLLVGDRLQIGGREFAILTGGGHSADQVMLFCPSDGLFLAGDQVLARISPNISVRANEPEGDPLSLYLQSLKSLTAEMPHDVLVLPGHHLPFHGLPDRITELINHHGMRCDEVHAACNEPRTVAELVTVAFPHIDDDHNKALAFGETLAHVNHLRCQGRLAMVEEPDGQWRVRAS